MSKAKIIVLQFRAEHHSGWTEDNVKNYEMEMVDQIEKYDFLTKIVIKIFLRKYKSNHLKLYVFSTSYVESEMVRAGISLLPYLTVGFIIMCLCSVISVLSRAIYMQQHSPPKVISYKLRLFKLEFRLF